MQIKNWWRQEKWGEWGGRVHRQNNFIYCGIIMHLQRIWYEIKNQSMIWDDIILYHIIRYCIIWYYMIGYYMIWCDRIWYYIILHDIIWCNMIWHHIKWVILTWRDDRLYHYDMVIWYDITKHFIII